MVEVSAAYGRCPGKDDLGSTDIACGQLHPLIRDRRENGRTGNQEIEDYENEN